MELTRPTEIANNQKIQLLRLRNRRSNELFTKAGKRFVRNYLLEYLTFEDAVKICHTNRNFSNNPAVQNFLNLMRFSRAKLERTISNENEDFLFLLSYELTKLVKMANSIINRFDITSQFLKNKILKFLVVNILNRVQGEKLPYSTSRSSIKNYLYGLALRNLPQNLTNFNYFIFNEKCYHEFPVNKEFIFKLVDDVIKNNFSNVESIQIMPQSNYSTICLNSIKKQFRWFPYIKINLKNHLIQTCPDIEIRVKANKNFILSEDTGYYFLESLQRSYGKMCATDFEEFGMNTLLNGKIFRFMNLRQPVFSPNSYFIFRREVRAQILNISTANVNLNMFENIFRNINSLEHTNTLMINCRKKSKINRINITPQNFEKFIFNYLNSTYFSFIVKTINFNNLRYLHLSTCNIKFTDFAVLLKAPLEDVKLHKVFITEFFNDSLFTKTIKKFSFNSSLIFQSDISTHQKNEKLFEYFLTQPELTYSKVELMPYNMEDAVKISSIVLPMVKSSHATLKFNPQLRNYFCCRYNSELEFCYYSDNLFKSENQIFKFIKQFLLETSVEVLTIQIELGKCLPLLEVASSNKNIKEIKVKILDFLTSSSEEDSSGTDEDDISEDYFENGSDYYSDFYMDNDNDSYSYPFSYSSSYSYSESDSDDSTTRELERQQALERRQELERQREREHLLRIERQQAEERERELLLEQERQRILKMSEIENISYEDMLTIVTLDNKLNNLNLSDIDHRESQHIFDEYSIFKLISYDDTNSNKSLQQKTIEDIIRKCKEINSSLDLKFYKINPTYYHY